MSIKLIAADLDGTLLTSDKRLPDGLFAMIRELRRRGVRFAPALRAAVLHDLRAVRRDRGRAGVHQRKRRDGVRWAGASCSFEAMDRDVVRRAVQAVRETPGVSAIVSARDGGFY